MYGGADKVEERQTKNRDKRKDLDEDNANIRKKEKKKAVAAPCYVPPSVFFLYSIL